MNSLISRAVLGAMVLGAVVLVMAGYHLELLGCVDGGGPFGVDSTQ